jgi:hypothetical protein
MRDQPAVEPTRPFDPASHSRRFPAVTRETQAIGAMALCALETPPKAGPES